MLCRYQQEVEKERERALRKEEEQKKKMKRYMVFGLISLTLCQTLSLSQLSEGRDHATALQRQMMEVKAREEEVSCTAQSMDRPSRIVCVQAAQLEVEQAQIEKEQLELAMAVSQPYLSLTSTEATVYIQEERRERLEETARKAELG